jgi:hypothetical protein
MSLLLSKVRVTVQHIKNRRLRNVIAKKLREMSTPKTVDQRRHFTPYFRNMS